jgi:2-ketocyclohexanecarboxyl-CoA hydrolase
MDYQDIQLEKRDGVATITIAREEAYNSLRPATVLELVDAFQDAGWDKDIGVIVFTGAGRRAFCTGGDQIAHDGQYGNARGAVGMPMEELQSIIRDVPVPVIAKIYGFAIGGGHVLAALCDLTLAGKGAVFGQVGPKVGSVDPGFGTAYMARIIGEKKARELWFMCRRYSADEALAMGLVNKVVPDDELDAETAQWCKELLEKSPTALTIAKRAFNADTESIRGISGLGMQTVRLYYESEESKEGVRAFKEKRKPEFRKYVK